MKCSKITRMTVIALMVVTVASIGYAAGQREATAPEDLTLRVLFRAFTAYEPGSEVQRHMEDTLGFKIDFDVRPALEYVQATQTILASGDYPDIMEAWFADATREIRELAEDRVIIALDELLELHGPNVLEARPYEGNWYRPLPDGLTYSIPARFNTYGAEYLWFVRQDYLDNLGLEVPTTLEEFRSVARALTFDDPNLSGRDDTYGIDAGWPAHARSSMIQNVLAAHGVMMDHWQFVDGELTHWMVNPGTLDALKFMRELYLDGVVDPEFALQQRPAWLDNMRAGRYGMQWWWSTHIDANASEWWGEFVRNQPEARISFIPPFPGPDGELRMPGGGVEVRNPSLLIFDSTPEPNRVAAMQFVNYLGSEEGAITTAYGIEGQHHEWRDGELVSFVTGSEAQARAGTYLFAWIFRRTNFIATNALGHEWIEMYAPHVVRPIIEEVVPAQTEYGAVLNELAQSRFMRIQTERNLDVDAEWSDYVRVWLRSGGQEWTDQINAAWRASQ